MKKKILEIAPVLKREALPEQIVRQLVGLIQRGELKPGERLPAERSLADRLGVGRPTLREALRALQLIGILDIRHGGGVFVSDQQPDTVLGPLHLFLSRDPHNLHTVLEARRVIEGALLAFAASTISDTAIRELEKNLAALEKVVQQRPEENENRSQDIDELAQEFRAIIEGAIDNPILVRAIKSLDVLSAATRKHIAASGTLSRLLASHRHMVDALAQHDPAAARQALEAHIDYVGDVCSDALHEKTDA